MMLYSQIEGVVPIGFEIRHGGLFRWFLADPRLDFGEQWFAIDFFIFFSFFFILFIVLLSF